MIVTAFNPSTKDIERTFLTGYHAAGVGDLTVKNNNGFATSKAILIGSQGDERAELQTTDGVTGAGAVSIASTLRFGHNGDDPVYLLKYNQVKFYRAATIDGSYTVIATVDLDVDNEDEVTKYDDTSGTSGSYYKIKYYNSVTMDESDFSDPIAATGAAANSAGKVIDAVARRVKDPNYTIFAQEEYFDIMNEVNDDLLTQAHRPYRFLKTRVELSTTLDVDYIDLGSTVTDFWKFNYVEYAWTTGGVTRTYQIKEPLSIEAFQRKYARTSYPKSDQLIDVALDEDRNRLYLGPTPKTSQTGVVILHYYKKFDVINSFADLVETPNTLLYRYKMMAEFYAAKAETDSKWNQLVQRYENKYGNEVVKLQRANRLDAGTPRSFAPGKSPAFRKRYHL